MADTDWTRVANTTMHEYVRQEEPQVLRNRKLLAAMQEKGRISMNHAGDMMDWKVRWKQAPMIGYADTDILTFARRDKFKTAQIPWRGYATTDSITKMEKEKNKSTEAIIKVSDQIAETLMEDMDEQFGTELYCDGEAAGNSKRIHGLESMFGVSGASAAGIYPSSDTYAGLNTVLQGYGGAWNGTWPTGEGDAHYDFWTPLIIDADDNTVWGGAAATWVANAVTCLRFGIIKGKKNTRRNTKIEMILMNDEFYRQFEDAYGVKENLYVTRGGSESMMYKLGFTDVLNFDGIDLTYEYGVPASTAYGLPVDQMELCSLQSSLFMPSGPDFDMASQSHRFAIDFLGNMKFKGTRYFTKWRL